MKLKFIKQIITTAIFFNAMFVFAQKKDVQVPDLTSSAQISLLTVGRADDEIWQNFGHTAIRVKDSILGWDLVFNYGTFDFSDPDFMMKFIKRTLLYYESIDNFSDFEQMYREENRWIREQVLNLSYVQKQTLFERLTINAREENKYYIYDFLFDNCSTRPRDIILSLFKNKTFKTDVEDAATYRQLIDRNVPNEWLDVGMDILIGIPTDQPANFGRTFLPDELMQAFDSAIVDGHPLTKSNVLILDAVPQYQQKQWITPDLVFWILFFVILLLQLKFSFFSKYKFIPILYFSILGLLGYLFLFLWFFTDHQCTKWNFNILWAMPLNIPFTWFLMKREIPKITIFFIKIYRIVLIILLVAWGFNPQTYHSAVIPLILTAILFTSIFLSIPKKDDFKNRLFG